MACAELTLSISALALAGTDEQGASLSENIGGALIIFVLVGPIVMQLLRTFWPARLTKDASRFKGIYRRYRVEILSGRVEGAKNSTSSVTIGHYAGTVSSSGHVTIDTTPTTFENEHITLLLRHANDACSEVVTINMSPTVRLGDLVSVARLHHGRRAGYVFMVYNHSTHLVYQENLRSGQFVAKGGIAKMIMRLPVIHQVALFLLIVTIPVIFFIGIGAQLQIRQFRNHGSKRLIAALGSRGEQRPAAPVAPAAPAPAPPPAPAMPATWLPDPTGRHQQRYWDGARWTDHVADDGAQASDPASTP